ncbi:prepilin-type N-terminal cleavage/methylation domain-containing protein [Microbacterium sp. W1N]|uniref:type II secretion system protein n=1 Tax=Microbacterium festucae TaxID=2977531 RepID=UPI0021BE949D|nr:prepilin-type N-terminal cleavage/methylation domain-containing protein [Microbacterium festucae]MCT9821611.1 prepilin-type N-terminal cleavage/methylation domain-containing protein [Microbacterium festucae]
MIERDDEGMTLVELIVVIAVSALFVGLLAGLFINGIKAQEQATARDRATGQANVVSSSIGSSVRNAVAVRVSGSGSRLDARVLTAAGGFECRAWVLDGTALRYSAGATPRSSAVSGWTPLATGVAPTLSGAKAFALQGTQAISFGLTITDNAQTATVTDGAKAQGFKAGGVACF